METNWYSASPEDRAKLAKERAFIPDDIYPQIRIHSVSPTADFIATRQGPGGKKEFLLVRRTERPWQGEYMIPGGRIRGLETAKTALPRNVKRELGFIPSTFHFIDQFGVLNPEGQDGGEPWFSLWNLFEVTLTKSEQSHIKLDATGEGFRWFDHIEPSFIQEVKSALVAMGFHE